MNCSVRTHFAYFSIFLFSLSACKETRRSYEAEMNDLEQRAYNINFQFVNESALLSNYLKILVDPDNLQPDKRRSPGELREFYSVYTTGDVPRNGLAVPAKLDSSLIKKTKLQLLTSKIFIGTEKAVCIYPKMNLGFLQLETDDLYISDNPESKNSVFKEDDRFSEPFMHPAEKSWCVAKRVRDTTEKDKFIAGHFSLEQLQKNFIESASGTFVIVNNDGKIIAASRNAYQIMGMTKPKSKYVKPENRRNYKYPEELNVFNSRSEEFRDTAHDVLYRGVKRETYNRAGDRYMVIATEIKELKWKLMRIMPIE